MDGNNSVLVKLVQLVSLRGTGQLTVPFFRLSLAETDLSGDETYGQKG